MKNVAPQKKVTNENDKLISWARKNYLVGNFYQARKLAHQILHDASVGSAQKAEGAEIIRLTSIDKLALGAGILCVFLTGITAVITGY
jgi:hypothetical protein